jgi:hypothetical protein
MLASLKCSKQEVYTMARFDVAAGKYEPDDETGGMVVNVKYAESFDSLDAALVGYFSANDYPFCELVYFPNGNCVEPYGDLTTKISLVPIKE